MLQPVVFAAQSERDEGQPGQNTARLLNLFQERSESSVTLRSAPGLKEAVQIGNGPVRALESTEDGIYGCVDGLLKLWTGGTVSTLGTVGDGVTTMASDVDEVAVTSGGKYHVWNHTSQTLTQITPGVFANAGSVATINGFFIITQGDGQTYSFSSAGNAAAVDALDFAGAEYRSDNLRRVISVAGLLWFMGKRSIEPWTTTGNADLPFDRYAGTVLEKGLRTTEEAAILDNTLFWVSPEGRAYRSDNFRPMDITTDAVSTAIGASAGYAVTFQERRHDFFVSRLTGRPALVYDASTQSWWERSTGPTHEAWEVTASVFHDGTWYAGTSDGRLCTFEGFNDLGKNLRREAVSRELRMGGNRFTVNRVLLDIEGSGTLMVSHSNDGGRTFSNERQRSFGAAYRDTLEFHGFGQHRDFCLKVAFSDDADFSLHNASVDIS